MSHIGQIVGATLDRIERRAYERGKADAASRPAPRPEPLDDATSALIAAFVQHSTGGAPFDIGERHTMQLRAAEGTWAVETARTADMLSVTVTRLA